MSKSFYIATIIYLGCLTFSLEAAEKAVLDEKGEVAAGMIEASHVAKDYLEGVDKGQYANSWTKADPLFQKIISQSEWVSTLEKNRQSLGKVKSRILKEQLPAWNPSGLPKGLYMLVEYQTSFEKAPRAEEVLTLRRDSEGKWHILTYHVK